MRTTVRLPDDLMRALKRLAAETDRTLTEIIEDALRETLSRARRVSKVEDRYSIQTFRGTGLMPGVDLDNTSALLDLMEEPDRFR